MIWIFLLAFTRCESLPLDESTFRTSNACRNHAINSSHVIHSPTVDSLIECARECLNTYNCVSFSFGNNACTMGDIYIDDTCSDQRTIPMPGTKTFNHKNKCLNGGYLVENNCWCVGGFVGENCQNILEDCTEATQYPYYQEESYILQIKPKLAQSSFPVLCYTPPNDGRTVILARFQDDTDFNRDWKTYKEGFGNLSWPWASELWIGLEKLHLMTNSKPYRLRVIAGGQSWSPYYAQFYYNFTVTSEDSFYTMNYAYTTPGSGPLGDSLFLSKGMPFSTHDKDSTQNNCPVDYKNGWWFSTSASLPCSHCNPMGIPSKSPEHERLGTNAELFFDYDLGNWAPHAVSLELDY